MVLVDEIIYEKVVELQVVERFFFYQFRLARQKLMSHPIYIYIYLLS